MSRGRSFVFSSIIIFFFSVVVVVVRGDEYAVAIERAIIASNGLQAVGAFERLLERLLGSYCAEEEESCAAYEASRKQLWLSFAEQAICGAGSDAESTWTAISKTNIQGAFAILLGECATPWYGDLEEELLNISTEFLALASLERVDVKAVIDENDRKAGRSATAIGDDLNALHPSYIADLAPVATEETSFSVSRPVVVTAQPTAEEDLSVYDAATRTKIAAARTQGAFSEEGATEAFPDAYAARVELSTISIDAYKSSYLTHPFANAHYDKSIKCANDPVAEGLCYSRVLPEIGVTHAEGSGTRLLTPFGQPLPADYVDYNQPRNYAPGVRVI